MKMTWKKNVRESKNRKRSIVLNPNLPFGDANSNSESNSAAEPSKEGELLGKDAGSNKETDEEAQTSRNLALEFEAQGNKLAEEGKYREALGKWETAITLMPEKSSLHEQKAQVLLEIGETWNALKAATRAMELEPSWAEAWITLGRAQLNFGEPDCAIESFDKALAIKPNHDNIAESLAIIMKMFASLLVKPDSAEAKDDRQTALHLVKRRKQLHSTGLSSNENRFLVGNQG